MRAKYSIPPVLVVAILCVGSAVSGQVQSSGGDPGITAVGFTATGNMATLRQSHSSTLLPNGLVLVAGGTSGIYNNNAPLTTAELYNPTTEAFTTTGSLNTARSNHSATILPNGKALIVGGLNVIGASLASAELYDPATGTFTATGSLGTARYGHTATLLPNGTVLVAGGSLGIGGTISAEIYNPGTGTFAATGNLIFARTLHSATLLSNGKVLVAGGLNCCAVTLRREAELYDPSTGLFEEVNQFMVGVGRYDHTATALADGKVLIAGGYEGSGGSAPSAAAQLYDPAGGVNGTFTATGSLSAARGGHSATLLPDGRVLIAGAAGTSAELYSPSPGTFSNTGSLGTARRAPATLLPSGLVLFPGGSNGVALQSAELFNAFTPTFLTTNSMSGARFHHTATLLSTGNILVAGGLVGMSVLASAEVWNQSNIVFGATGSLPGPRYSHTATLLPDGKVLIAGGSDGVATLSSALLYDSFSATFTPTGNMATARKAHTATLLANGTVLMTGGLGGPVLGSAEIFDPATGTFAPTGSLSTVRFDHSATLLHDGTVLIAAGSTVGAAEIASAERYNPTTGSFSATGNLSQARVYHSATLLPGGKVLIAGGQDGTTSLALAELYNPSTGTFSGTGNLIIARTAHSATLLPRGTVLIAGGSGAGALSSAEIYNPATGTFSFTDDLNAVRFLHKATLMTDGRVLLTGGRGASGAVASADRYYDGQGVSFDRRPVVTTVESVGQPSAMTLGGTKFRDDSEASGGATNASATDVPMLRLERVDNGQVMWVCPGTASTDTSFTSTVLTGVPHGHYRVTIVTNAVSSLQRVVAIGTLAAPTGLTASVAPIPATSNWSITMTWSAIPGVNRYEVYRAVGSGAMSFFTSTTQPFIGPSTYQSAVSGTTSVFKVRAVHAGINSAFSPIDIATTVAFTDTTLAGVTAKAAHITELRTAVNAVRTAAGLAAAPFGAAPTAGVTVIQRQHVIDLRTALDAARTALGLPAIIYTDPVITVGGTPLRAAHITELRAGTQ